MTVKKEELDGIKQDRMARMLTLPPIRLASLQQELLSVGLKNPEPIRSLLVGHLADR